MQPLVELCFFFLVSHPCLVTLKVSSVEHSRRVNKIESELEKMSPLHPPERRKFFEMSSFVETKGMDILKGSPIEFVEYP